MDERSGPDLPRDEFIDDIPFPQTQNYVKKILGTAEDYRRLYGPDCAARQRSSRVDAPLAAAGAGTCGHAGVAKQRHVATKKAAPSRGVAEVDAEARKPRKAA